MGNKFTHGKSGTKIYIAWCSMKYRCKTHKYYLGRGITYIESWEKFENFYKDMKNGFSIGLTLDRRENNGNYCKSNCRWVNRKIQANNTRQNNIINGKPLIYWAEKYNIKYSTLRMRILRGKTFEESIMMGKNFYK